MVRSGKIPVGKVKATLKHKKKVSSSAVLQYGMSCENIAYLHAEINILVVIEEFRKMSCFVYWDICRGRLSCSDHEIAENTVNISI